MNWEDYEFEFNPDEIFYDDFYSYVNTKIKKLTDLKNQYINLMSELTVCEELDNQTFYNRLKEINSMGQIIIAYKHITNGSIEIIGSGTVIVEPKIIRGGKPVAHIEDIVIKKTYRGQKISQTILNELKVFAKLKKCYKVILDCDEHVSGVYKSNGFEKKGIQMGLYF